jgi:LysM repeat protein
MCGAVLEDQPELEAAEAEAPTRRMTTAQVVILAGVALLILAASALLGWNLSQGNVEVAMELPTFTPTLTEAPTMTSAPTRTPTPTFPPTVTPTPTPVPPRTYVVQAGDTLLEIALDNDMTVEELKAYNGLDSDIILPGESLLIPPPTPTPGPTPTLEPGQPTHTPAPFILYTVQAGDTLSTIAEQFGVSETDLRMANDIPADSDTIQAGQALTIPQYTPTPESETALITSGTTTPSPAHRPPPMLYPPEGARFVGPDATIVLQWGATSLLADREFYELEIVVPTSEGEDILKRYMRSTAWRMPEDLFPPPEVSNRTCAWRVSIVRQVTEHGDPNYKILSQMVKRRTFTWDVQEP